MKSSRFLVYSDAPSDRALKASKQSLTKAGSLVLRSGRSSRTLAKIPPASFHWLWLGVTTRPTLSKGRYNISTCLLAAGERAPAN